MNKDNSVIGDLNVGGFRRLSNYFKSHKNAASLLGMLLIVIVLVGGIIIRNQYRSRQDSIVNQAMAFQDMIKHETAIRNLHQEVAARKILTDFLAQYPNNNNKLQLNQIYTELAASFESSGDTKSAEQWQTKAFANASNLTYADYYNLAGICQQNGDKACAITNFNKALDLLKQNKNTPPTNQALQVYINGQLMVLKQ